MSEKKTHDYPQQIVVDVTELNNERRKLVCEAIKTFIDAFHMVDIVPVRVNKGHYHLRGYNNEEKRRSTV